MTKFENLSIFESLSHSELIENSEKIGTKQDKF